MKSCFDTMWEADLHQALGNMAPDGVWIEEIYFAPCPLHADAEASFRYDRRFRTWHCDAACGSGDLVALGVRLWQCGIEEAIERMLPLCGDERRSVERRYPYLDERGQLDFEVLRYSPKCFHTRVPVAWFWNDVVRGTVPYDFRKLYRLPEVLAARDVLIAEGEKDCETARTLGLVATCNAGGSSRWHSDFVEFFRGKRVRIIADADESGRKHARNIAGSLFPVAESVQVIEFVGVKDLTEWVEAGGTAGKLEESFQNIAPLQGEDVLGWWDPLQPVQLQCEARFLFEPDCADEMEEPAQLETEEAVA